MRIARSELEEFFVPIFLKHVQENIDTSASEIVRTPADDPDLAIRTKQGTVGVEFSQIPSSYIIQELHKKLDAPGELSEEFHVQSTIYPYEPHQWVYEVLQKKEQKLASYKKNLDTDKIWLVLHSHSKITNWPNFNGEKPENRELEAILFRFGIKNHWSTFEKIFYIYQDGSVLELKSESQSRTIEVSLQEGSAYPTVSNHHFAIPIAIPEPGSNEVNFEAESRQGPVRIIEPKDDWMKEGTPDMSEVSFDIKVNASSEILTWELFLGGVSLGKTSIDARKYAGTQFDLHFLYEMGIKNLSINYVLED